MNVFRTIAISDGNQIIAMTCFSTIPIRLGARNLSAKRMTILFPISVNPNKIDIACVIYRVLFRQQISIPPASRMEVPTRNWFANDVEFSTKIKCLKHLIVY